VTMLTKERERELNLLLKNKKKRDFILLYYSEWCDRSAKVLGFVEKWKEQEGEEHMYLISSWELPHAFAAFAITSAPSLVFVKRGKVTVKVEYPTVYEYFNPSRSKAV
jgi:hypothetical protein